MTVELESIAGGGPNTQEGKEVARWNSTRHGIRSPAPVVPGVENKEDWEDHREGVLENLSPKGHLEFTLAERVALLAWRLHRVTRYETETIALSYEKIEEDFHDRSRLLSSLRDGPFETTHPGDIRFQAKHDRNAHNALKRLPALPSGNTMKAEDASSIVWGVLLAAEKVAEAEIEIEALDLPGVPEDAYIEELPAMKTEDVRGCIEAIAKATKCDSEELLETATEQARSSRHTSEYRREDMEKEVSRYKRERILPDDKTLEKISRYEAHLSRQLFKALHELEALQARRSGGAAPLARIDVDGSIVSLD